MSTARVRALAAYKDFLTLWKDPDDDIPIPKEAKAEYGKAAMIQEFWPLRFGLKMFRRFRIG
jgi:hypothetical protein